MKTGQVFRVRDINKRYRVYMVTSVCVGGKMSDGHEIEDMIGVKVLDKHNGSNGDETVRECFIPDSILNAASVEIL